MHGRYPTCQCRWTQQQRWIPTRPGKAKVRPRFQWQCRNVASFLLPHNECPGLIPLTDNTGALIASLAAHIMFQKITPRQRHEARVPHRCPGLPPGNLSQLTALVRTRLKRMQYRPGLLDGFLASTGLDLTPFCTPHERSLAEVVGGAPTMPARPVDEAHPARS